MCDPRSRQLHIEPAGAGVRVIVSGHSHKPLVEERDGVLYVNPGSSGPRRFKLPIALGELLIDGESVTARVVVLGFGSPDDLKLKSCATLFACVLPAGCVFDRLLQKYYGGNRDARTLQLLGLNHAHGG